MTKDQNPTPNTSDLTPQTYNLIPSVGVVLAGGSSRRMGQDKALLALDGSALIHRVIGALQAVFREVLVVGRAPGWINLPGVRCVDDSAPGCGPLGGLATALTEAAGRPIFVAGCDMPFLSPAAITFICDSLREHDAAAPEIDGILQPLHAAYSPSCQATILSHLSQDKLSLQSLLRSLSIAIVPEDTLRSVDPDLRSFRSLNTQEEYASALKHAIGPNHGDTEDTGKSKRASGRASPVV